MSDVAELREFGAPLVSSDAARDVKTGTDVFLILPLHDPTKHRTKNEDRPSRQKCVCTK